jgi:hypothetical protein
MLITDSRFRQAEPDLPETDTCETSGAVTREPLM